MPSRTLEWLVANEHPAGGIRAWFNGPPYPEVTGYLIPTLLAYGERELAGRCAKWLLSLQRPDGSYPGLDMDISRTFDTAAIVEGLQASRVKGARAAAQKGLEYLRSMRRPDGTLAVASGEGGTRCYTMRASAILGDSAPAGYWMKRLPTLAAERLHYIAYCLEGLWIVGQGDYVRERLELARERFGAPLPMTWDGAGVDYCATAQFGVLRAWAGLDYGPELDACRKRVEADGSIRLTDDEQRPTWTAKFYLDLEHLDGSDRLQG